MLSDLNVSQVLKHDFHVNAYLCMQLIILFLSFRCVLNVIYSFLGNSPASEF